MKTKTPNVHKQRKFIKYAISQTDSYAPMCGCEPIVLDHSFCAALKLSEDEAIYIAFALSNKGLITFKTDSSSPFYRFTLTEKAFSFIPDMNDYLFRFWFPLLITAAFSVASLVMSIIALATG